MKLAIFGATGKTGQQLLAQALAAGNQVTVLVRNPAKLTLRHPSLTVVQGEIGDAAPLKAALTGADAVLSVLGASNKSPQFAVSRATQQIIAAMKQQGISRLVVSAGAGVGDPNDVLTPLNHGINLALKLMARTVFEDMMRTVAVVRESDLDWTVVRVPILTDGAQQGAVRVGYVGKGVGTRLTRADMAAFMLRQVGDRQYSHQAPAISN